MLEDLGRKGALLEVHDRLSWLNSWNKDSPAPQEPHHAFMKQEYWSLVEKEKLTHKILLNQEREYYDTMKLLKQRGAWQSRARIRPWKRSTNYPSPFMRRRSEYWVRKIVRWKWIDTSNVACGDCRTVGKCEDSQWWVRSYEIKSGRYFAIRSPTSQVQRGSEKERRRLSDANQADIGAGTEVIWSSWGLNAMRKEFSGLFSDIPTQVKYRDENIQGLKRKLAQMETELNRNSTHDHQRPVSMRLWIRSRGF